MRLPALRVALVLFLGLLALGATACRPTGRSEAELAGVLRMGVGAMPKGLDHHVVNGIPEAKVIEALMEGLVGYHPTREGEVEAAVAERWEVSEDGLTYTFHLRPTAKWSNGDPVVAADFLAGWERILRPAMAANYREMLYAMENAQAYAEGTVTDFAEVGASAPDAFTLVVKLRGPTPYFVQLLSHYTWFPVHRPTLDKFDAWERRDSPWTRVGNYVGNGPFALVEWTDQQVIRVARSETYWDRDRVALREIRFLPVENTETEVRMFDAGQLDVTDSVPFPKRAEFLATDRPEFRQDAQLGVSYLLFNCEAGPLANPAVRRALSHAVDRAVLPRSVTYSGQPATRFTPAALPDYDPGVSFGYDPEKARAELAAAGFPGGRGFPKLTLSITTADTTLKIAEVLQAMWREELGIEVGIHNMEWRVLLSKIVRGGDYEMSMLVWIGDYVYPDTFHKILMGDAGNNRTGWANAEYDALMNASFQEPDLGKRRELLEQAERIMLAEQPVAPMLWSSYNKLVSPAVKGWVPKLQDLRPYKYVSVER